MFLSIFLPIIISVIVAFAIGFLWYGPKLFGNAWKEIMMYQVPDVAPSKREMAWTFGLHLVTSFVMFFAITYIAKVLGAFNFQGYAIIASFLFLGFIVPLEAQGALWSGRSNILKRKMFLIGIGAQFLGIIALVVVLTLFS